MFLKTLTLNSEIDNSIIRRISFKMGMNCIVDMSSSKRHNKVGKTTFLKLIDICLGAKGKKYLYEDAETRSINTNLQNYINDNKISVTLVIADSFTNNDNVHTLKVELQQRGKHYIDGIRLSNNDYCAKLNKLMFKNENANPSFRQLIKSFARISLRKDEDSFLNNLPNTSHDRYRVVYDYLFDISDQDKDIQLEKLKSEEKKLKNLKKEYAKRHDITEIDDLNQIIEQNNLKEESLKKDLENMISSSFFKKNKEKINNVRKDYAYISECIGNVSYNINKNKDYIKKLRDSNNNALKMELAKDLFSEVKSLVPSVNKTFEELVSFNEKLSSNKIDYLKYLTNNMYKKKKSLEERLDKLVHENENLISLVKDDKVDEYNEKFSQLTDVEKNISELKTYVKSYNKYNDDLKKCADKIKKLDNTDVNYGVNISKFNNYFSNLTNSINGEEAILVYRQRPNFPLFISHLNGTSTGTRKSLITAYDLAYQKFSYEIKKDVPNFVIHDVMENIESENLSKIIKVVQKMNSQYIISVLNENLQLALDKVPGNINEDDVKILKLSSDDMLFKIK